MNLLLQTCPVLVRTVDKISVKFLPISAEGLVLKHGALIESNVLVSSPLHIAPFFPQFPCIQTVKNAQNPTEAHANYLS